MLFRPPPGFAFACTGCGGCCTAQNIGPLSSAEVTRVRETDHPTLRALAARVGGGLFRRVRHEDGGPVQLVCRQTAAGCVFLSGGGLCTLHAALGAEAKFVPCRMFPYRLIETPGGVDVTVLPECRQWLQARRAGLARSRAESEAEWTDLLALEQQRTPFPDLVPVFPGRAVRYDAFRGWEDRALGELAAWESGSLPSILGVLAATVRDAFGPATPPPTATPDSLHDLLLVVREFLVQAMDEFPCPGGPEAGTHAWTRALVDSLDLAPLYAARVAGDAWSPEARELLREGALNFLFGKGWMAYAPLVPGLAVTHLLALLTANLAAHLARLGRRFQVDAHDVQDATTEVYRLGRASYFRVLVEHAHPALLRELFFEADGLERRWHGLEDRWAGPEMYVL